MFLKATTDFSFKLYSIISLFMLKPHSMPACPWDKTRRQLKRSHNFWYLLSLRYVARKQSTRSLLTLSYSLNSCKALGLPCSSSEKNYVYSFFSKSTSVSLTRLAAKWPLRSLSNSLTELLIGPAITWISRHLKKWTTGNFNGHFSSNFSQVCVRNAWQSS